MPFLEATILELLRYKTTIPVTLRSIRQNTEVAGYVIPRGTLVRFSFITAHDVSSVRLIVKT